MSDPDLAPDCSRCDALCCVLLAFDASAAFAFDKPACVACMHLAQDNACGIHAERSHQGFAGCAAYSCHGAGQRITQSVFKGRSWRDDPGLLPAIEDAFRTLRQLHQAVALLDQAARLPLPSAHEQRRQDLLHALDGGQDWTETSLRALNHDGRLSTVRHFLAALRDLPEVTPPHR